jgi:tetratricopeptide (TPR) repeat protein
MRPAPADVMVPYVAAIGHVQAGRFRESADAYLTAYLMPSCAHTDCWWNMLRGFTSIVCDGHFPASDKHLKALKRISRDESYPLLHRAEAQLTRGLARYAAGNREEAARDYTATLEIISRATPAQRKVRVWDTGLQPDGNFGLVQMAVGDVLDQQADDARCNLGSLRRQLDGQTALPEAQAAAEARARTEAAAHQAGIVVSGTATTCRPLTGDIGQIGNLSENEAALADAMKRLAVGGDRCDRCGQPASENAPLKRCARCQLAYYCSPECSKQAWKAGHKAACRAPGQFEVGDKVQVQGLVSQPQLNGSILEVRGAAPGGAGRIATALIGGEVEKALKPENLRRLRPVA